MEYMNYTFMEGVGCLVDEYISASEFAKRVGVTLHTIHNWDKTGKLKPHHRTLGGKRLYSVTQLENFLSSGNSCHGVESS